MDNESLLCLRRSFAMMALAMLSHQRDLLVRVLLEMPSEFRTELLSDRAASMLGTAVRKGDVTVIVTERIPYRLIFYKGTFGEAKAVFGIKPQAASWRGKSFRQVDTAESEAFGKWLADNPNLKATQEDDNG
jgi:hypothetical protein